MSIFADFGEPLQPRGKPAVIPNGLAREGILPFCHQAGCLPWWLGALVAHFLETRGTCQRHFDGLGGVDVKKHGFKVPKSAHFHGFAYSKHS